MRSTRTPLLLSAAALAAMLTLQPLQAEAQDGQTARERGSLFFGAFITNRDTSTRFDSDAGSGTDINLEDDLGFEGSTTVFRLGGDFWVGERHRFDITAFDLSRTASKRIEETIEFGDRTFEIDTVVSSTSDLTILKAAYTYAFVQNTRGYFGVTGGLYIAEQSLTLSEPTLGGTETGELTAPLPVIGFRGDYNITDRVTFRGAAEWFSIDTGDASGTLRDYYLAMDYRLGQRWAIGLAYNEVTMGISAEDVGNLVGEVDWGYDGWLAYVKFDFGR